MLLIIHKLGYSLLGEARQVIAKYIVRNQIDYLWKVNHIKILFLCSRNKWRSLTAEKIFHRFNGYEVRSAGAEENARIKVTSGHIGWADLIFVMEKKHNRRLKTKFGSQISTKKIICLDIPDDYQFMDLELIEILKARLSEYIDVPE